MPELNLRVVVDPDLPKFVEDAVAFGDFESSNASVVYQEIDYPLFFRDLIFGRKMPLTMVTRDIPNLGVLLAASLFLHRDLAIHPATPGLLSAVSLADSYGVAGLAHIDRDLSRFFRFLSEYWRTSLGKQARQEALKNLVGWIHAYMIEGSLPALPAEPELPLVIDRGTDGFVIARCSAGGDLFRGWEELFRAGFLRGLVLAKAGEDRWRVLGARKSTYLSLDLGKAASILNEAEEAMGEPPEWVSDGIWLHTPSDGTLLLPTAILEVFLRV